MTHLPDVTVVCVDCFMHGSAVAAIKKTLQQIKPARTVFITNIDIKIDGVDTVIIPAITSKRQYSVFIIKELYKHFDTPYVLVIQHDGYVLNGDAWNPEFLNYDIIGAPWLYIDDRNLPNGGFSIRTKRLQEILGKDDFIEVCDPEDEVIGRLYRRYLEQKYDIRFPTEELADTFSFELRAPICKTFGFHGKFHEPFKETVIIRRMAAMGDVIQVEPVLEYFHNKGYRVVLETLPQFEQLFQRHYFPVLFPHQIDPRVLATAQRFNLDMSYESDPKKLHQQAYFEFCGIKDFEVRRPKLSLGFEINKQTKLFQKLAIIHVDNRSTLHRNIYGVNWSYIAHHLSNLGYTVIQVGKDNDIIPYPSSKIETINENLLAYVCASADIMIGIDSGISHICSGFNVPCVIGFGSVNPDYIHPDMSNIIAIHNHDKGVCSNAFCWHSVIGVEGVECEVEPMFPPCTKFETSQFLDAINKLTNG